MAKVSISKAARLAGVARSNFYTTYIKKGRISVSTDAKGKKFIDTSELLRVFPDIKQDSDTGQQDNIKIGQSGQDRTAGKNTIGNNKPDHSAELELLRQQLQEAKENQRRLKESEQRLKDEFLDRESWYRQQIEKQDDKIKLLEHHHLEQLTSSKWWQFWK